MARSHHAEAEKLYRHAITVQPGYAIAIKNLGATLRRQKRYDEAEEALRQAITVDPNFTDAILQLAEVLSDQS